MKRCNGFFSFSIVTVAVLTLSLALTAATLAWQHFQMAALLNILFPIKIQKNICLK